MNLKVRFITSIILAGAMNHNAYAFLEGTTFETAAQECNLDPVLLYSVALAESGYSTTPSRGVIAPMPYSLRSDRSWYPQTRAEAEKILEQELNRNVSVDIGLMQINSRWHAPDFKSAAQLLDPENNLKKGAKILCSVLNDSRYTEIAVKLGHYHNPSDHTLARTYGEYVLGVYYNLKDLEKKGLLSSELIQGNVKKKEKNKDEINQLGSNKSSEQTITEIRTDGKDLENTYSEKNSIDNITNNGVHLKDYRDLNNTSSNSSPDNKGSVINTNDGYYLEHIEESLSPTKYDGGTNSYDNSSNEEKVGSWDEINNQELEDNSSSENNAVENVELNYLRRDPNNIFPSFEDIVR